MKKFSRRKLYNELLTSSLKELATKYHVNYNDFSKFCHKNNIPIPGSKYRMYQRRGRDVKALIKPLPDAPSDSIYFKNNRTHQVGKDDDLEIDLEELNNPQKLQQIKNVLSTFKYNSKRPLSKKVRNFKKRVKLWKNSNSNKSRYEWNVDEEDKPKFIDNVSTAKLFRLYRLLDIIYLVFDELNEEVKDDFSIIIGGKDEVEFEILEDKDKVPHQITKKEKKELEEYEKEVKIHDWAFKPQIRKYDHPYNGHFRIRFRYGMFHTYVKDTQNAKLEEKIPQIIICFYKTYIQIRDDRIKREEEEKREEKEKQRKIDRAKLINLEKDKIQILIAKTKDYNLAVQIRKYAESIKDKDKRDWILQKADWLDPNVNQEDKILGKRDYTKNNRNLDKYLCERIDIDQIIW